MDVIEILNILSKSYRSLATEDTEEGKEEWFIINKFKKLFISKNYLEGKISDRIIEELVNTFKGLHTKFYLEGLKCVNIFDLLMCKDYASGKITENEVLNIIRRSVEERTSLLYRYYYDDSTRVYSTLVNRISDHNNGMNAFTFEKALKIKNKLEVYDYLPLLLSDNFQNGLISEEHLCLIGKIPKTRSSKGSNAVKRAIKVLISDNYKEGLITDKHLSLFFNPQLLPYQEECNSIIYNSSCRIISTLLIGEPFKDNKIKVEDIISLLNAIFSFSFNIKENIDRVLHLISSRSFKEEKFSINDLIKFIEQSYDFKYLYLILANGNFRDGLITKEQIEEVYNPNSCLDSSFLTMILNSEFYRDGTVNYDDMKKLANLKPLPSNEEQKRILILNIVEEILYKKSIDNKTKKKYISTILHPDISNSIYERYIIYVVMNDKNFNYYLGKYLNIILPSLKELVPPDEKPLSLIRRKPF